MPATRLTTKRVEKPWGRTDLPAAFGGPGDLQVGEIWFDAPDGRALPLLVKYIFTSENLSIQVHPDDAQARARGLPGGKSECWYILDAEPGATLAIGTKHCLDGEALRAAALDGTLEGLMDWKPVGAGDYAYIPAGTIHAIGAGITLVEVQQNNDVTYRLYDYGRPRELHLDDGVQVSKAEPYARSIQAAALGENRHLLEGDYMPFALDMVAWAAGEEVVLPSGQVWFVPISGTGTLDAAPWRGGECWLLEGHSDLHVAEATTGFLAWQRHI